MWKILKKSAKKTVFLARFVGKNPAPITATAIVLWIMISTLVNRWKNKAWLFIRLYSNQKPLPSQYSKRILSAARLRKTNNWPEVGSLLKVSATNTTRPSICLRKSIGWRYNQMVVLKGSHIIPTGSNNTPARAEVNRCDESPIAYRQEISSCLNWNRCSDDSFVPSHEQNHPPYQS